MTDEGISVHNEKLYEWAAEVGSVSKAVSLLFHFIDARFVESVLHADPEIREDMRKELLFLIRTLHDEVEIKTRDKRKDQ